MPLMKSTYSWTIKIIDAMVSYIDFHLHELSEKSIRSESGPWDEYANVLHAFVKAFKHGFRQRCEEERSKNIRKKQREDLKRMKNLPTVNVLHEAVRKGCKTLLSISMVWAGQPSLPPSVRALANACLCGTINLATFMGRSKEWEILEIAHVSQQLQQGLDATLNSLIVIFTEMPSFTVIAYGLQPGIAPPMDVP